MSKKLFSVVTLKNGDKLIVDRDDAELVRKKKWHTFPVQGRKYARSGKIYLQKFILGEKADGALIKFKNNNSLDCRRSNLQILRSKLVADPKPSKNLDKVRALENSNNTFHHIKDTLDKQQELVTFLEDNKIYGVYPKIVFESKLIVNDREYNFGTHADINEAIKAYNNRVKSLRDFLPVEPPLNKENITVGKTKKK